MGSANLASGEEKERRSVSASFKLSRVFVYAPRSDLALRFRFAKNCVIDRDRYFSRWGLQRVPCRVVELGPFPKLPISLSAEAA